MTFSRRANHSSAFTLVELILVLLILAIMVGVLAPSLRSFTTGRTKGNTATQIIAMANFARTQSIAEGERYRLNFDLPPGRSIWLTAEKDGTFAEPNNEADMRFDLPDGMQLDVDLSQQQAIVAALNSSGTPPQTMHTQTETATQENPYVEFHPSGRTDIGRITLTDKSGESIVLGSLSATDIFHVLSPEEAAMK